MSVAYGSLPFKEQIAFFRAKQNVLTERWTDVWEAEHDHAFMVAGANRIDLLVDLRQAVDKAIADGTGLEAFRRDFDTIVTKRGWDYNGGRNWRARVIFETNLRTSYAAGRYAQLQALKKVRPFWRYRHSDSVQHPRPMHVSWNGLVLHADDPWWHTHYPPNGWGCQCTVEALNLRDLQRLGKDGPDQAPPVDLQEVVVGQRGPTPRTVQTPAGIDPGFGYAPGRSAYEAGRPPLLTAPKLPVPAATPMAPRGGVPLAGLVQDTLGKATGLPALAGAEALRELLQREGITRAIDSGFSALQLWLLGAAGALASDQVAPADVTVGALDPELVRSLTHAGATPATAPIVVQARPGTVPSADVPSVLRQPQAVLLDQVSGQLLYVVQAGAGVREVRIQPAASPRSPNTYVGEATRPMAELQHRLDAGELRLLQGHI